MMLREFEGWMKKIHSDTLAMNDRDVVATRDKQKWRKFFFSNDFDDGYLYMGFKIEKHEQEPAKGIS